MTYQKIHKVAYAHRFALALGLGAGLLAGQTQPKPAAQPRPAAQAKPAAQPAAAANLKTTVEQIVHDYILRNPDVVMESLRGLQERTRADAALKAKDAIATRRAELASDELTPVAGNTASDVTLTFFFDYRCGYCKKVTGDLMPFTQAGSKVRVIFKELPILGPESDSASRAALAAAGQGAYLEFHQALMKHQGAFSAESLEEIARGLKLDVAKWKAEMAGPAVEKAIRANQELAASVGVQATPSFVAGNELAAGALDAQGFSALIEKAKSQTPAVKASR